MIGHCASVAGPERVATAAAAGLRALLPFSGELWLSCRGAGGAA